MNIFPIIGIAVITAVSAMVLKRLKEEYAVFASIAGGLIILALLIPRIGEIISYIRLLTENGGAGEYTSVILKSIGFAFISQIGSDICRGMGEDSVAEKVEFAGKIAIIFICLPVIKNIIGFGMELLS